MNKLLCFLTLLFPFSLGFIQEMIIYSEPDCKGNFHGFQTKEPNLFFYQFFLINAQSYRSTGWWQAFSSNNFENYHYGSGSFNGTCINYPLTWTNSLRYLGPLETSIEAIAATEGHGSSFLAGREIVVTADSATNFSFIARGALISGFSNWTLYTNSDFTGNATCVQGKADLHGYSSLMYSSVIRGCGEAAEKIRESILKDNNF